MIALSFINIIPDYLPIQSGCGQNLLLGPKRVIRNVTYPAASSITPIPNPANLNNSISDSIPIPSSSNSKDNSHTMPMPPSSPTIPIPSHPDSIKLESMCQKLDSLFHGRGHSHCLPPEVIQSTHKRGFWVT
ncbi:MAG: hypothetical protein H0T62_03585 [Parachlamydiaceae bacterium]|nr:hypothetical protein [Parachlamydiaceae bacterium]